MKLTKGIVRNSNLVQTKSGNWNTVVDVEMDDGSLRSIWTSPEIKVTPGQTINIGITSGDKYHIVENQPSKDEISGYIDSLAKLYNYSYKSARLYVKEENIEAHIPVVAAEIWRQAIAHFDL